MIDLDSLMFTRTDEWVKYVDKNIALVGITENAIKLLGKIKYISLPKVGDFLKVGDVLARTESSISDGKVYSPFDGIVVEVNDSLAKHPEQIIENPFGVWIAKIEFNGNRDILLSYEEYCEEINS
ncbi:MAG: glycine cleavage system protein H [Christensenellaceae bacterium]|nr:glycine cleavage system protein H [Christensenellaceae bacterium]